MRNRSAAQTESGPGAEAPVLSAEVIQHLIDQAAHFNMFSMPDPAVRDAAIRTPGSGSGLIGFRVNERLHRFDMATQAPTARAPLKSRNTVGEAMGRFCHRWVLAPDDFVALPNREPPPTPLDASRSQRFVMLDGVCTFGEGENGFRGFGAGRTFPTVVNGQPQLQVAAVGTLVDGFGKFGDHDAGTYLYCGTLDARTGFNGNVLLRVMDAQATLHSSGDLPALRPIPDPDPDVTYALFRGQAVPSDPVSPRMGLDGKPIGLTVIQGLRLLSLDFFADEYGNLKSTARVGQVVGRITAHVTFNPAAPGGTIRDPIPFTTFDEFAFFDPEGVPIGRFTGDSSEGRVFHIALSGQRGIRFGGVGHILSGEGPFEGMTGLLTDNSVVAFTPHVSASVYVLRIQDPEGRFRTALRRGVRSP